MSERPNEFAGEVHFTKSPLLLELEAIRGERDDVIKAIDDLADLLASQEDVAVKDTIAVPELNRILTLFGEAKKLKAESTKKKIIDATERAAGWLHKGNIASEKGKKSLAEKYYDKSQFWHDRMTKLMGNR